jgi:hypothetical protein
MHLNNFLDSKITFKRFKKSPIIKKYLDEHPECANKSVNEICLAAGGPSLLMEIFCFENAQAEKNSRMEAMLNKHSGIYPELLPLEDESK